MMTNRVQRIMIRMHRDQEFRLEVMRLDRLFYGPEPEPKLDENNTFNQQIMGVIRR